jgi:polyisoprenoid-binding protein YceI
MKKLLLALPLLAAVPLFAQMPPPPGKPNAALVKAGTYSVEGSHTQVLFAYDHMGFTNNMGLISGGTGTLTLDPKKPAAASVTVEMPISTMRTTIAKLDEEFQGPKFFDAAKFPTAKFVSTMVMPKGATAADIMGNLTIHGVTKPVTLKASFAAAGPTAFGPKKDVVSFNATADIKRSDFGLGGAVPLVGDAVSLKIVAAFEKPS